MLKAMRVLPSLRFSLIPLHHPLWLLLAFLHARIILRRQLEIRQDLGLAVSLLNHEATRHQHWLPAILAPSSVAKFVTPWPASRDATLTDQILAQSGDCVLRNCITEFASILSRVNKRQKETIEWANGQAVPSETVLEFVGTLCSARIKITKPRRSSHTVDDDRT